MTKTNASRIFNRQGIKHEILAYEADESGLNVIAISDELNQNIDQVFKTLVLRDDKSEIFVCIIPVVEEVNLKKAVHLSSNKSAAMVPVKEIFYFTSYIRGGCSPTGMKKNYPTFIDENCPLYDFIFISARIRGL